jgi:hypothetical protein
MGYLAINVNYKMDMDWYCRCQSVLECYQYFSRLEPGDGRRTAIYDIKARKYLWISEESVDQVERLDRIVDSAIERRQGPR